MQTAQKIMQQNSGVINMLRMLNLKLSDTMREGKVMKKGNSKINQLLDLIDQAYDRKAWHGTNLRGSIRGLTVKQALWRPASGRHNIWEIVVHAAYWKYIVRRRTLGEKKGSFPLKGSNWFPRDVGLTEHDWRKDIALLDVTHRSLREGIEALKAEDLPIIPIGSKVSNLAIFHGIASHDLYHAGQIQLLKRLQK